MIVILFIILMLVVGFVYLMVEDLAEEQKRYASRQKELRAKGQEIRNRTARLAKIRAVSKGRKS